MLATLNTYRTGCADVAGDCNAANAMANMLTGYANRGGPQGDWFLMLADIPGVTVQQVTDVAGQADVAFGFPFTGGVTEILLGASTHQFVGYVRGGVQTVITKEVTVSGPGSLTLVVSDDQSLPARREKKEGEFNHLALDDLGKTGPASGPAGSRAGRSPAARDHPGIWQRHRLVTALPLVDNREEIDAQVRAASGPGVRG